MSFASGVEKWSIRSHKARARTFESCPQNGYVVLRTGRLPVEEYGASLNLVVAASFAGVC